MSLMEMKRNLKSMESDSYCGLDLRRNKAFCVEVLMVLKEQLIGRRKLTNLFV